MSTTNPRPPAQQVAQAPEPELADAPATDPDNAAVDPAANPAAYAASQQ